MIILLTATVSGVGAVEAPLAALVAVTATPQLTADVEPLVPGLSLLAVSGDRQDVRGRVIRRPDGAEVEPISWSVGADLGAGHRWSLVLPASVDAWRRGALGYEIDWHGPPTIGLPLSFRALYSGSLEVELLRRAVVASSSRSLDLTAGHLLTLDGVGPEGEYDLTEVNLRVAAGHGLTPAQIIRDVAVAGGVAPTAIALPAFGPQLRRAIEFAGAGWLGRLRDLASAFGHTLDFDRFGQLVAAPWPPVGEPEATFGLGNLAAGGLRIDADAAAPTCVRVLGNAPELPVGGEDVTTDPPQVVEVYRDFDPPRALFVQHADGSLSATGASPGTARRMLVSRVTTIRRRVGTCPVYEEVTTEGWFAPRAARYTRETDGTLTAIEGALLYDAAATEGGAQEAFAWPSHRFVVLSSEAKSYHYQATGGRWRLGTIERRAGWFNPPHAVKERNASTSWEETAWLEGVYVEGGGRSVSLASEYYHGGPLPADEIGGEVGYDPGDLTVNRWLSSVTTIETEFSGLAAGDLLGEHPFTTSGTEILDGYLRSVTSSVAGHRVLLGDGYLYDGGATGATVEHEPGLVESTTTTFAPSGPASHLATAIRYGPLGEFREAITTAAPSYLPARERCSGEDDAARSARPIDVTVCAIVAPGVPRIVHEIQSEWIETTEHALALAAQELRRQRALSIQLEVPLWAVARAGMAVRVDLPFLGLAGRPAWIESFEHRVDGPGQPHLTSLVLRCDP